MSQTDQPEELPSAEAGRSTHLSPDLTIRPWKGRDMGTESEGDKAGSQSVFSSRSGIQDPLVKPPIATPAPEPETPPSASATEAVAGVEESVIAPAEETLAPVVPDKKRKGKGTPKQDKSGRKLVKSRRQLDRARRRQENYLQKRRKEKKLKVFYGRIKSVLKLCFAVVWAVLLWKMAHSSLWLYNAPRFDVQNQRLVQASQLAPLVKPWVGKPIYTLHTGKLADQIEAQFDLVDRAVVRRSLFPARLSIQIFEKKPWAALYVPASYDQYQKQERDSKTSDSKNLDATGLSAPPADQPEGLSKKVNALGKPRFLPYGVAADDELISLKGYQHQPQLYAGIENIVVNPQTALKSAYLLQLREIAWQARQIKGLTLKAIDIRNPEQVILRYREIPVILGRLNGSASDRLARLAPLLPKIQEYRDVIESVDLKWEEQVTFHKRPNAQLKLPQPEKVQG
ncbi:cell division protein FtsQ/DivIB [Vampirovibrio sp.]|uniref:cell division protein FtsQ/DivIB n=1 Tax=Vampirovibrio sp. TaxID=2717857 RepID=UPI00359378A2